MGDVWFSNGAGGGREGKAQIFLFFFSCEMSYIAGEEELGEFLQVGI